MSLQAAAVMAALAVSPMVGARADTNVMVGVKNTMPAVLIAPDGAGPFPGILVLHTSGGLQDDDLRFARDLAKEGYVALVPAFMQAYGLNAASRREAFTNDAEPIYADLVAALGTLARDPHIAGRKLGAVGFSNGGYFALWLAATGKVQAGISYYGALNGAGSDRSLSRFKAAFARTSAPVLILHGMQDDTVPVAVAQNLGSIVESAGSPVEIHLYDGAGHRFDRTPGSPQDAAALADAWPRTLAFLGKYLKQP